MPEVAGTSIVAHPPCGSVRGAVRIRPDGAPSLAFRGIPYAAAPVGPLRFGAPIPHRGWEGVRDARHNGPTPTLGPRGDGHSVPEPAVPGAEVLNLNVFTPELGARLPVYVWIHGGSYVSGSPGGPWFDGAAFNASGVVVVAITYRLGFEGYGHLPGAPTNRALRDMIAALTWVQENIAAFGGDPRRVTLGGQSAGAGAVLALLGAPAARGLFQAAVSHSAPLPDITAASAEKTGVELARACGVSHTLAGWQEVPREKIVAAERALDGADLFSAVGDLYRVLSGREPVTAFGPVLDGDLLPDDEATMIRSGSSVPLLLGATSHEFNRLTQPLERYLARGVSGAVLMGMGLPPVLARAYPRAHPQMSPAELLGQAITDRVFRIPAARVATERARSRARHPLECAGTWLWDFRWRSPATGRAVHCVDLPFAWRVLDAERVSRIAGADPPQPLADEMHASIATFVRTHRAPWQEFISDAPAARVWDTPSWTGRDPFRFERIATQVLGSA